MKLSDRMVGISFHQEVAMKKFQSVLLATLAVALIAVVQVRAGDKNAPTDDKDFLTKAHGMCQTELKISELAEKQATNPMVREFAAEVVKDHQKFADELSTHAKNHRVATSTELSKDGQAEVDRLSKLQGAEFDKEYIAQVIKDHEKAIEFCQGQVNNGTAPELKKCSQERLTILNEHLNRAKEIAKSIKS
jgi:putative membrane protein